MSETRRRSRAETAEPEAPEAPEDPTQEPEPEAPEEAGEPEPEVGSVEAQQRKIDNAQRKYRRDLEGIVGDLGDAVECQLCGGLGFTDPDSSLRVHPEKEACKKCGALGQLVTGSRAPGHETLPCPDCSGSGYTSKMPPALPAQPDSNVVPMPPPVNQVHGWFDPVTQTFHPYGEVAPS